MKESIRTYAEVDGQQIEAGWHEVWKTVADWRPMTLADMQIKPGGADDVAEGLYWRSWTVEPERVVLFWGDAEPQP
jgi:hypothetical protein